MRKVAQYFYPQRQTQVMNEGWATFWHHRCSTRCTTTGILSDGMMIEWLKSHTNVIFQPPVGHPAYSGINPTRSASRCTPTSSASARSRPTRTVTGSPTSPARPWLPTLDHAMRNYKDESFVGQFLSPQLMRELRLFAISDDEREKELEVSAIHDEAATGACARRCRTSTTWAAANPTSRCGERQPARRPGADAAPPAATTAARSATPRRRCCATSPACGASASSSRASTRRARCVSAGRSRRRA